MHHNLKPLSELDDWQLEHSRQDIRGRRLVGPSGEALGTVREMLVDRDHERVAAITLSDGRTVPVEQIEIRDDYVLLKGAAPVAGAAPARAAETDEVHIPIVEEQIKVGKRQVETGGVRVSTHVVEEPVREAVRLREEHVEIERRPVEGGRVDPSTADDLLRERSVEMVETVEEAVVAKEARVTDEVVIRKEREERVAQIEDTVRHTEVDVERLPDDRR